MRLARIISPVNRSRMECDLRTLVIVKVVKYMEGLVKVSHMWLCEISQKDGSLTKYVDSPPFAGPSNQTDEILVELILLV